MSDSTQETLVAEDLGEAPVGATPDDEHSQHSDGAILASDRISAAQAAAWSRAASLETHLGSSEELFATTPSASRTDELSRGTSVGRYLILSRLGAGAMGVVYAGYDPQLDRKVAIKLLRAKGKRGEAARARLQREAQALAKLNHPNVVGVHDVGLHEGQVFVAMEFVAGETLASWMRREKPGWRRFVRIMDEAGEGLAAAHEQGLVHRDFKPDNVMIGRDGRVRVMDFGLARSGDQELASVGEFAGLDDSHRSFDESLTRTGAVVGTPAYMAPEQFSGSVVTAHSDQFSFCVVLFEGLYGRRPFAGETLAALAYAVTRGELQTPTSPAQPGASAVPNWLRQLVERGLSREPAARHPDMRSLLSAVANGEGVVRRRRYIGATAGLLALIGVGVGALAWRHQARAHACEVLADSIASVWDASRKQALQDALAGPAPAQEEVAGSNRGLVVAQKVAPWLDRQAQAWRRDQLKVCRHHQVDRDWDDAVYARGSWCLDEARFELQALVNSLLSADPSALSEAVPSAAALKPTQACTDRLNLLRGHEAPPQAVRPGIAKLRERLAQAASLRAQGQYDTALEQVRGMHGEIAELDWKPLQALAANLEGILLHDLGRYEDAQRVSTQAYVDAASWGVWTVAADASSLLAYNLGFEQSRTAEGLLWSQHTKVALQHSGDPLSLGEARRLVNIASSLQGEEKYTQARELVEQALDLRRAALPSDHPDIATTLNDLGYLLSLEGRYEASHAVNQEALRIFESVLGPVHLQVAMTLNNQATNLSEMGQVEAALGLTRQALEIRSELLGPKHPKVAESHNNLGTIYLRLNRLEEARDAYRTSIAIKVETSGPDEPDVALALNNLASVLRRLGEHDEAMQAYQRALEIRLKAFGPEHPKVANTLNNLAFLHLHLHEFEESAKRYREATDVWATTLGAQHPQVAHGQTGLAKALLGLKRYDEALALLETALHTREAADTPAKLIGDTRFTLARALHDAPSASTKARERARVLAGLAQADFAGAGPALSEKLAEVDAWRAAHP